MIPEVYLFVHSKHFQSVSQHSQPPLPLRPRGRKRRCQCHKRPRNLASSCLWRPWHKCRSADDRHVCTNQFNHRLMPGCNWLNKTRKTDEAVDGPVEVTRCINKPKFIQFAPGLTTYSLGWSISKGFSTPFPDLLQFNDAQHQQSTN